MSSHSAYQPPSSQSAPSSLSPKPLSRFARLRKFCITFLAGCLAIALLARFILRAGNLSDLLATWQRAFQHPVLLVSGIALAGVSLLIGVTRWFILLKTLRVPLSFLDAVQFYATGHFFNSIGPGATGGDFVKATWIACRCLGHRTAAVTSIFVERFIGLTALLFFITLIMSLRRAFFSANPALTHLRQGVLIAFWVCVVTLVLFACLPWERLTQHRIFHATRSIDKLTALLLKACQAFQICLLHPVASLSAGLLSILNHVNDLCGAYLLSRSIGMTLPFKEFFVVTPIANTLAAIPLTPGGIGIRENTLQTLLDAQCVPRTDSTALGLLILLAFFIWALIAGLVVASSLRTSK